MRQEISGRGEASLGERQAESQSPEMERWECFKKEEAFRVSLSQEVREKLTEASLGDQGLEGHCYTLAMVLTG